MTVTRVTMIILGLAQSGEHIARGESNECVFFPAPNHFSKAVGDVYAKSVPEPWPKVLKTTLVAQLLQILDFAGFRRLWRHQRNDRYDDGIWEAVEGAERQKSF